MRVPTLMILSFAAVLTAAPGRAQTYDPRYPVCIEVYDSDGRRIQCGFDSMEQCAGSAAGRSAQCVPNPYFGGARGPGGPRPRGTY